MSDLPDCWARLQSELAPQIPPEAVTIRQFADSAGVDGQRVAAEFKRRVDDGELMTAKKGRSWYYWPSDSKPHSAQ